MILFCFLLSVYAKADSPPAPPEDTVFCSPNGRYCLVSEVRKKLLTMIDNVPSASQKELETVQHKFGDAHLRASHVKFPHASKMLWQINFYSTGRYLVANDGIHYAIDYYGNLLGSNNPDLVIFRFYAKDAELNSIKLKTIMHDLSSLVPTVSHFNWAHDGDKFASFDLTGKFILRTLENRELMFDKTGKFIGENPILSPPKN
jgi:hypothetical protein